MTGQADSDSRRDASLRSLRGNKWNGGNMGQQEHQSSINSSIMKSGSTSTSRLGRGHSRYQKPLDMSTSIDPSIIAAAAAAGEEIPTPGQ